MVDRAQLGGAVGALVWGTDDGTGLGKPNLHRQTTRHEVTVAAASARSAAAGYAWQRDEKPSTRGGHQADGVALAIAVFGALIADPSRFGAGMQTASSS
jgi:hypothetical protein